MHSANWLMWAVVLFFQNISFTYVSRARSSGSLMRHLKASLFSNGIWIVSQMILLGPMFDYLTGKHGIPAQVLSGAVYTVACVGGSIFAHHLAMKTEKGKNAVGYSAKYAQIPVAAWEALKAQAAVWETLKAQVEALPTSTEFQNVKQMAGSAYDLCVNLLPDSGISAQKFGDEIVTTGLASSSKS
jgi:hypothetical protein